MAPELHPNLEALAPLLGTWVGQGAGNYPTIEPFEYLEEVVFSHVGKPFLVYAQKTRAVTDGKPLHAETGYLRVPQPGHVELVLAHPNGITEIEVGSYSVTSGVIEIELASTTIGLAPTAKEVSALHRVVSRRTVTSFPIRCRWVPSANPCRIISPRCCTESLESGRSSVQVCHAVLDGPPGHPNPALAAPGGLEHRSSALGDTQVAAEIVGNPYRHGAGCFVLGNSQIRSEHPRTQRPGGVRRSRPTGSARCRQENQRGRPREAFVDRTEFVDCEFRTQSARALTPVRSPA